MPASRISARSARTAGIVAVLVALALVLPHVRRAWVGELASGEAEPELDDVAAARPQPAGGLAPVARTRVVLLDGLRADTARGLPAWSALCARGASLEVDAGYPTVSLPVEVELWTGLTQQQTGIVSNGGERVLAPTLAARGITSIPSQAFGSQAIAENHAWIARSLGFADVEDGGDAHAAVTSSAGLVFVHLLRVDGAGHRAGADSEGYRTAAREADAILGKLVAAAPDARWFALSDHGHLPGGGHGGDETAVRLVAACIAGPGVSPTTGSVRAIDVARAIADSVGARVDPRSHALPLAEAIAGATGRRSLPRVPPMTALLGLALVALGAAATVAAARDRLAAYPWWWLAACGLVVALRGEPTASMAMTFRGDGWTLASAWLAALPVAAACAYRTARVTSAVRAAIAQLALPVASAAAAITAAGGWATALGADLAPAVPRYGAVAPALMLAVAHGAAAVALGIVAAEGITARAAARSSPARRRTR